MKRKGGVETLVTTRKTSRNAAETLPDQGTLPAAVRCTRYQTIRAFRMGLQPAHSLQTGAAAACSRFVLRSAAVTLGMVVIRIVKQLRFQGCREAPGAVWDEACRGHMLPPHGRSRAGVAGKCLGGLGNEPNQERVISRNHSMNSKLGTVQVWTEAEKR